MTLIIGYMFRRAGGRSSPTTRSGRPAPAIVSAAAPRFERVPHRATGAVFSESPLLTDVLVWQANITWELVDVTELVERAPEIRPGSWADLSERHGGNVDRGVHRQHDHEPCRRSRGGRSATVSSPYKLVAGHVPDGGIRRWQLHAPVFEAEPTEDGWRIQPPPVE